MVHGFPPLYKKIQRVQWHLFATLLLVPYLSCCIEDDHSINCLCLCVAESLKDITNVDALETMIFKFLELQVRF